MLWAVWQAEMGGKQQTAGIGSGAEFGAKAPEPPEGFFTLAYFKGRPMCEGDLGGEIVNTARFAANGMVNTHGLADGRCLFIFVFILYFLSLFFV